MKLVAGLCPAHTGGGERDQMKPRTQADFKKFVLGLRESYASRDRRAEWCWKHRPGSDQDHRKSMWLGFLRRPALRQFRVGDPLGLVTPHLDLSLSALDAINAAEEAK